MIEIRGVIAMCLTPEFQNIGPILLKWALAFKRFIPSCAFCSALKVLGAKELYRPH